MQGKGRLFFVIIIELIYVSMGVADDSVLLPCVAGLVLLLADWLSSCMQSKVNRFLCVAFALLVISVLLDDVKYTLIALVAYVIMIAIQIYAHVRKKNEGEEDFSESFTDDQEEQDKL